MDMQKSWKIKFDSRVLLYKDIVKQHDHDLDLERSVSSDSDRDHSPDILDHFNTRREDRTIAIYKLQLLQKISNAINSKWQCEVLLTGSTLNGFGAKESDLDLTVIPGFRVWDASYIFFIKYLLDVDCGFWIKGGIEVVKARVPILKFRTRRPGYPSIQVDLSFNNINSVRNTHLLYCYSQLDWRLRPLVLAVKKWARDCKINDASDNTLSSYALTLMVIFYLQSDLAPPVLPCLQDTQPGLFKPESSPDSLRYKRPNCEMSSNTQSLGILYKQFFDFYNSHIGHHSNRVISIRFGGYLSKDSCQEFSSRHRIGPERFVVVRNGT